VTGIDRVADRNCIVAKRVGEIDEQRVVPHAGASLR
jgi:hypothetical protein